MICGALDPLDELHYVTNLMRWNVLLDRGGARAETNRAFSPPVVVPAFDKVDQVVPTP